MKNVFVTLFDSGYLSRGLVMYESLLSNCESFRLYIIAFDDTAYNKLKSLDLKNTIIISLKEFEDEELLSVKESRSRGEYCWTSTPKSVLYVFNKYHEEMCTYIDADMQFFADPSVLTNELSDNDSVMITEHRYAEYCNQTDTSGKYCVQFMPFKNEPNGLKILNWWKDKCLDNCGHDVEKGICGDQKYLDNWCELFDGVRELQNIGGGVAPWNVDNYIFSKIGDRIYVSDRTTNNMDELVFFHYHALTFFDKGVVRLTGRNYIIPDSAIAYIYKPFFRMHKYVCEKYNLGDLEWRNIEHFNDDDVNHLIKNHNYYYLDLFY